MKNKKYHSSLPSLLVPAALIAFSISVISCPPLEQEPFDSTLKITGILTSGKWNDILDDIYMRAIPTILDLSECTAPESGGDILKRTHEDGRDFVEGTGINQWDDYIQFNPSMGSRFGKELITKLIVPDAATMINNASDDLKIDELSDAADDELNRFAFRHFTNLRSVTGKRISLLGTFAFYNSSSLEEANFPNLVIVMQYAFYNCISLKKVEFEKLRHIQPSAFMGCTSLERAEFHNADRISQNAFMNCKNLREVSFSNARDILPEAFRNCTSLRTARFLANPWPRTSSGFPLNIQTGVWAPDLVESPDSATLPDSVAFHNNVFRGCMSLAVLDVRNAWNVYFGEGSLADIGSTLELHLYDDKGTGIGAGGRSYGHPQIGMLLGDVPRSDKKGGLSLTSLRIVASAVNPIESSRILHADYTSSELTNNPFSPNKYKTSSIRNWINSTYNGDDPNDRDDDNEPKNPVIRVTVERRPAL